METHKLFEDWLQNYFHSLQSNRTVCCRLTQKKNLNLFQANDKHRDYLEVQN